MMRRLSTSILLVSGLVSSGLGASLACSSGESTSEGPNGGASGGSGGGNLGGAAGAGGTETGTGGTGSGGTAATGGTGGTWMPQDWVADADPEPDTDTSRERALRLLVRFYGAQRSGNADNWLLKHMDPDSEHPSCFPEESPALGWFDAGDHINSTLTNAYSSMLLLTAYEAFPRGFDDLYGPTDPLGDDGEVRGTPNGIPDVLDEVKYSIEYLANVGTGDQMVLDLGRHTEAHKNFHTCLTQQTLAVSDGGTPRPVVRGNGGAAAGMAAAALALMARHYERFDAEASQRYAAAAQAIFAAADPAGVATALYRGEKPAVGMLCGAAELYRLTQDDAYLTEADELSASITNHGFIAGWDNPHEFCFRSLYLANGQTQAFGRWWSNIYRNRATSGEATGMIYVNGNDWGTLRHATTAAFSLAMFNEVSTAPSESDEEIALSQLDFILGEGASNRSWIVGFRDDSPKNPHHLNSYGWDVAGLDASQPNKYTLYGALVGGPVVDEPYEDVVSDFRMNEVAIDYNAGAVGLAAFGVELERR